CLALTAILGLSPEHFESVAYAAETKPLPVVVWLHGHECTGCDEAFIRSTSPYASDVILNMIALEYHETLAATAGTQFNGHLEEVMEQYKGQYILAVEGAVPLAENGIYCMVNGKPFEEELKHVAEGAMAVVEYGSCATWGGVQAANPNPTNSVSVSKVVKGKPIVKVPGCPPIPEVMTNVIMHFALFGELPPMDELGRPLQFYGNRIHDTCYKRPFFDSGKFVEKFDDEGAKKGWCLYKVGCRGPVAYNSCGNMRWWNGLSYPIQSGHGCIGCSENKFWDNDNFYNRLPQIPVPNAVADADTVGLVAGGVVAAAVAVHAGITTARHKKNPHGEIESPELDHDDQPEVVNANDQEK
ncbi:MAG: hydrogenase small subunit, partial [Coriobacteriia bacterium]|nr:hydrogenase small subunit [Coriobacteriia bacterium]